MGSLPTLVSAAFKRVQHHKPQISGESVHTKRSDLLRPVYGCYMVSYLLVSNCCWPKCAATCSLELPGGGRARRNVTNVKHGKSVYGFIFICLKWSYAPHSLAAAPARCHSPG